MSLMLPKQSRTNATPCSRCGKPDHPANMIEATRISADGPEASIVCGPCFWNPPGSRTQVPAYVPPPKAKDRRAAFAATSHKTVEDAQARVAKVASVLGIIPEILPRELGPGPYFVVPDSPLVAGFKPARNPYDI